MAEEEEEYEPRAYVTNKLTGERTPVRRDQLTGLDEFLESMRADDELPPEVRFSGWQEADDDHPVGAGRAAYRVVFKTVRTVPSAPSAVVSSNCRVLFANGQVSWGEPRFGRARLWRRPNRYLLPEWGRVAYNPWRYIRDQDHVVPLEAHTETTPPMNYLEVLYALSDDAAQGDHYKRLATARATLAPLLASLDLIFGPKLLGVRITEELGEVFDDWHWNRQLDGPTVALEAQSRLHLVNADLASAQIGAIFDANEGRSEEERARLRLAANWYWRADAEIDATQAYIAHWLTIEALEMESTNIAPVKRAVHDLIGGDSGMTAAGIGRLHGLRSKLVHGKSGSVSPRQLASVRAVALALLERRLLGILDEARREALRAAIVDANEDDFSTA